MKYIRTLFMIMLIGATFVGQTSCSTSVEARQTSRRNLDSSFIPKDVWRTITHPEPINMIKASTAVDIFYTVDNSMKDGAEVQISIKPEYRQYVTCSLMNGVLQVNLLRGSSGRTINSSLQVWIRNSEPLSEISLEGACSFNVRDKYESSKNLTLIGTGASTFRFNDMMFSAPGSLNVDLSGAASLTLDRYDGPSWSSVCSGAATIKMDGMYSPKATVVGSGACDIDMKKMHCQTLTAQSDGASKLTLGGDVGIATLTATGVASLNAARLKIGKLRMSRNGDAVLKYSDGDVVEEDDTDNDRNRYNKSVTVEESGNSYSEEIPEP